MKLQMKLKRISDDIDARSKPQAHLRRKAIQPQEFNGKEGEESLLVSRMLYPPRRFLRRAALGGRGIGRTQSSRTVLKFRP